MSIVRCAACGNQVNHPARFCVHCGKPLPLDAAARPLTPEAVRALAGWNGDYYARKLGQLFPDGRPSLKPSWNWAAALVPFWWLSRRLYLAALVSVSAGALLGCVHPALCWLVSIAQGAFGTSLYLMSLAKRSAPGRAQDR